MKILSRFHLLLFEILAVQVRWYVKTTNEIIYEIWFCLRWWSVLFVSILPNKMPGDNRKIIGCNISELARHVTHLLECSRRYGTNTTEEKGRWCYYFSGETPYQDWSVINIHSW